MTWGPAMGEISDPGTADARKLADLFDAGGHLPALAVALRLEPNEVCYAQGPVTVHQFLAGDSTYIHKTRFGLSVAGLAIGAATMAGNQVRKTRAAQEAAPQWRFTGQGTLYITNQRLTMRGERTWYSLWYRDVMTARCDARAFEIERTELAGLRLAMPRVHYYFVLFYRLAFGEVVRPPSGDVLI